MLCNVVYVIRLQCVDTFVYSGEFAALEAVHLEFSFKALLYHVLVRALEPQFSSNIGGCNFGEVEVGVEHRIEGFRSLV